MQEKTPTQVIKKIKKPFIQRIALSPVWSTFYYIGLKKEKNFLVENIAILLSSGMGVKESLLSIEEEAHAFRFRKIVHYIFEDIDAGIPLSRSLRQHHLLPDHTLALIEAGEQSGRLTENLKICALQNDKEALFRSRLKSSVLYAGIIFTMSIVIMIGLAWFVLPKIAGFFKNLDAELPPVTRAIISAGDFFGAWGHIVIPIFVVIILMVLYFLFSFPRTRFIGHTLLFNLPLLRSLIKEVELARFGFLLGTMLESGMSVTFALQSMHSTTTFGNYQRSFDRMLEEINKGNNFHFIFSKYKDSKRLFPASVRQMIVAGEKSGNLASAFLKIGEMFENKTESTARNLPVILEPVLLIFVAIIVATLAFGILMPIYNLSFVIS